MVKRWLRRALRQIGLNVPFGDVICAEQVRTIWIQPDWRARVTVRRTLVFLDEPADGDLRDTYAVEPGQHLDRLAYDCLDAVEIDREQRGPGRIVVFWRPRVPVVRYAPYVHEHSWTPPTLYQQPALCTEYRCEGKTGVAVTEFITPATFETAVAFRRPRWPRLTSEHATVKYALKCLSSGGERPSVTDEGRRVEWRIVGPRRGDRYLCVVFQQHGVAEWQERLKQSTLLGRTRRLITGLAHR